MKSSTDVCKGLYIDALTAEIYTKISEFLRDDLTDYESNRIQEKIKQIIAREYVEKDDQIIVGKQIHKKKIP